MTAAAARAHRCLRGSERFGLDLEAAERRTRKKRKGFEAGADYTGPKVLGQGFLAESSARADQPIPELGPPPRSFRLGRGLRRTRLTALFPTRFTIGQQLRQLGLLLRREKRI